MQDGRVGGHPRGHLGGGGEEEGEEEEKKEEMDEEEITREPSARLTLMLFLRKLVMTGCLPGGEE